MWGFSSRLSIFFRSRDPMVSEVQIIVTLKLARQPLMLAMPSLYQIAIDPWTTKVWTLWIHLYLDFFKSKYSSTRPAVDGICRCRTMVYEGPSMRLKYPWIWVYVGLLEPVLCGDWGMTKFRYLVSDTLGWDVMLCDKCRFLIQTTWI